MLASDGKETRMPLLVGALICIAAVSLAAGIAMFTMLVFVARAEDDEER
jgi:hypothetical protein